MNSLLVSSCPHCAHRFGDALELLDNNIEHDMRCERCRQPFVLLIHECAACAAETVITWHDGTPSRSLSLLSCVQCGDAVSGSAASLSQGE